MTEKAENKSDFIPHLSNLGSLYTLVCGFTFTTITLLVTALPDPKEVRAQTVLLFLTIVFDLFVYLIIWNLNEDVRYCSYVPPMTGRVDICNKLTGIGLSLWGFSIPAMFLLMNLDNLALVSTVIWIIGEIITYITIIKPSAQYRKTLHSPAQVA